MWSGRVTQKCNGSTYNTFMLPMCLGNQNLSCRTLVCFLSVCNTLKLRNLNAFKENRCNSAYVTLNVSYSFFHNQTFTGNTDQTTVVENRLSTPVAAFCLRLYPLSWFVAPCMRMEVLGCVPV